jgi:hypothetical protein
MLGWPRSHPDPIDPHSAVGGLVEAFNEVLDLGQHPLLPHGLGRLVDVHHCPLEVRHGAGYCVQTWNVSRRRAVAEAQHQCRGWSNLGAARDVRSGTLGHPEKAVTIGPLPNSTRLTQWRRCALGSVRRHDRGQRGDYSPMQRVASRPVEGGPSLDNGSLARFYWRVLDALDY